MTTRPSRRRPTAALAAPALLWTCLLAACSADFKSGMTKCAANKACPDGFTCNSLGYCTTPGGLQSPPGVDGGISGAGGTTGLDGGPKGTGGSVTFPGGTGGSGGVVDAGPADTGTSPGATAPIKFCNDIVLRNPQDMTMTMDTDLVVVIDGRIRLPAKTGMCSTALNQACTAVAVGDHSFALMEGTTTINTANLKVEANGEYVLFVDVATMAPVLSGTQLHLSGRKCATFDYFAANMPPNPMPPTGGMAVARFCNQVSKQGGALNAELKIGTTSLKAATGQCSTMKGSPCQAIPLGSQTVSVSDVDDPAMPLLSGMRELAAGDYLFTLTFDETAQQLKLQGLTPLAAGMKCQDQGL
jgi:hypothetical protein